MSENGTISLIGSVILGFLQGATEFLPVSSSGHLVIAQHLFGMNEPQVLFDVLLHVGTLAAVLIVFRRDVGGLIGATVGELPGRKSGSESSLHLLFAIIVGCVPTVVIGLAFADTFESMFASMRAAGTGLLVTGVVLTMSSWRLFPRAESTAQSASRVLLWQAFLIGTVQGIAIIPGISRSGITIAVALMLGVEREMAARFSFLLSVPAILGALVFELRDVFSAAQGMPEIQGLGVVIAGVLVAAVTGILALHVVLGVVRRGKISAFAYYCWALGALAIALSFLKP